MLLTVGVATFNGSMTIGTTLSSLEKQDFTDMRVIISDDGSTDGTLEICSNYVERNMGWELHRRVGPNGMLGNYKYLLSQSESEFFCFVDQDDTRGETFLSSTIGSLECQPSCIGALSSIGVLWSEVGSDDLTLVQINSIPTSLRSADPVKRMRTVFFNYSDIWMYGVYRKENLQKAFDNAPCLPVFPSIVLTQMLLSGPVTVVDETLLYYRAKGKSGRGSAIAESARVSASSSRISHIPQLILQTKIQFRCCRKAFNLGGIERIRIISQLFQGFLVIAAARVLFKLAEQFKIGWIWSIVDKVVNWLRPHQYVDFLIADPVGKGYLDPKWRSF